MNKPYGKIAIITRTKNRNILLERALQSVKKQSYKDYIHVILNDGGDKKPLEELLKKYPDYNRLVINNRKSVGRTRALNQAINSVDSEYICILDDDDSWHKDRLRLVVKYMDETSCKGAIVSMAKVFEKIEMGKIILLNKQPYIKDETQVNLYKQCVDNYLSNGCFNYRRDVYIDLGYYDNELEVAEDWDFGIRFLLKYDADYIPSNGPLVYYHLRQNEAGELGNSVFAGIDQHSSELNKLRNKYLRDDLQKGIFGLGYIMNDLAYRRFESEQSKQHDLDNIIRLEGHINRSVEEINFAINNSESNIISNSIVSKIKKRIKR